MKPNALKTKVLTTLIASAMLAGSAGINAASDETTPPITVMRSFTNNTTIPNFSISNNYQVTSRPLNSIDSDNISNLSLMYNYSQTEEDADKEKSFMNVIESGGSVKQVFTPPTITAAMGDYQALIAQWKQVNSETIGYLDIPGTNVNYPVVCNTGNINYYTNLDVYRRSSYYGCIWAHNNNRFGSVANLSDNTVLFGHNWTNYGVPAVGRASDIMFAPITAYEYSSYLQQHPYINFSIEGQNLRWQIFATFYVNLNTSFGQSYISTRIGDITSFANQAKALSTTPINVSVGPGDKILTLSTCTRRLSGLGSNQRFVVMAKLIQ